MQYPITHFSLRIQNVIRTGQGLIDKKQCQGAEEVVSQRLTTIGDQWEYLVQKSTEKSMKLKEASKQQVSTSLYQCNNP